MNNIQFTQVADQLPKLTVLHTGTTLIFEGLDPKISLLVVDFTVFTLGVVTSIRSTLTITPTPGSGEGGYLLAIDPTLSNLILAQVTYDITGTVFTIILTPQGGYTGFSNIVANRVIGV